MRETDFMNLRKSFDRPLCELQQFRHTHNLRSREDPGSLRFHQGDIHSESLYLIFFHLLFFFTSIYRKRSRKGIRKFFRAPAFRNMSRIIPLSLMRSRRRRTFPNETLMTAIKIREYGCTRSITERKNCS